MKEPGFQKIGQKYEDFKKSLLFEPFNVSFAVGADFLFYSKGIYTGLECGKFLNHGM